MNYATKIGTKPDDYVSEMKTVFGHGLYKASLMLAFAIPDICASLECESGRTSGSKYKKWCGKSLLPRIKTDFSTELSSNDLYQVRNSLLHNGSFALEKEAPTKFDNIRFSVFDSKMPFIVNQGVWSSGNGEESEYITINLAAFIDYIAAAVAEFLRARPDCDRKNERDCLFYSGVVDFTCK